MTAKAVLTYADYAALPDDGKRYELLDGELVLKPAPTPYHQIILGNLVSILRDHVRRQHLGMVLFAPLDVLFADTSVAQPDVIYLDDTNRGLMSERGIEGAPRLVAEVTSPSTATMDRRRKFEI